MKTWRIRQAEEEMSKWPSSWERRKSKKAKATSRFDERYFLLADTSFSAVEEDGRRKHLQRHIIPLQNGVLQTGLCKQGVTKRGVAKHDAQISNYENTYWLRFTYSRIIDVE